jgi:hypothetical protein
MIGAGSDDMIARAGKRGAAGNEVDVDPRVDRETGRAGKSNDSREGIEIHRLPIQIGRARFNRAAIKRFAPAAHLNQQRVEPAGGGRLDHRGDALG